MWNYRKETRILIKHIVIYTENNILLDMIFNLW